MASNILNAQRTASIQKAYSASKTTVFHHCSPEEIEQRKHCVLAAHEFHLALEAATHDLREASKLLDKPEIIEAGKRRIYQRLLETTEKCLAAANWQASLFFRNIGEHMRTLRDDLQQGLQIQDKTLVNSSQSAMALIQNMLKVYVSLYQADGNNLKKWLPVLNNLTRLSIGRPIYKDESAIIAALRTKQEMSCDGYVTVHVLQDDLLEPMGGVVLKDRLGNELLTVREGAIQPKNIVEFVRVVTRPEQRYRWINGTLVLM